MKRGSVSYHATHPLLPQYFGCLAVPAATQALHLTDGLFWGDYQVTSSLSAFLYKAGPSVCSAPLPFLPARRELRLGARAGSPPSGSTAGHWAPCPVPSHGGQLSRLRGG